ncbi:MAG TPA: rhomboid family intramembrane serine protease [Polyangia bacterium]|jgi:membrane associated rhomboid family serine protease|nr:rhomboid family intramembrane serine protease [Polyangia bacterium]
MVRSSGFLDRSVQVWRLNVPAPVALLVLLTALASIAGAVGLRHGVPLLSHVVLEGDPIAAGEPWRLVTWVFFELDPISLLFACLALYWFGSDLCRTWGARRFLAIYFGFTVAIALCTVLIGRYAWPEVHRVPHLGTWPITEALVIAWAILHPQREIRIYFVLPVGGRALIAITIGLTALYALFSGLALFVPHFLAEGLMLVYLGALRRAYLRWKLRRLERIRQRHVVDVSLGEREQDERPRSPGKPPRWIN